jgi:dTDP-4-amino-4,6-dideoxygalactose transaminase
LKPYIGGRPGLSLGNLFRNHPKGCDIYPLNHEKCFYFFSARYALAALIKASGFKNGDEILVPSYNCGVEIDPIIHYKVEPVFYKVNKDLSVEIDDLVKKITKNVRAILITHYLGFPQPIHEIKKICDEREIFLFEDCAHSFLSDYKGKHLGSYGDAAFFSLLKTLPVPNGGVLVINNRNIKCSRYFLKPNIFATCFCAAELLRNKTMGNKNSFKEDASNLVYNGVYASMSSVRLILAGFRKYFNPKGLYLVKPDSYLFIEELQPWGISGLGKRVINRTNFEELKNNRRRNFEYLLSFFLKNERGILPFNELPDGVCPLFFPIILESAEKRETLYRTLKRRGVITHPWWDRFHPQVPWDEYPDAVYLKTRLFGLPIHQDLTLKHLDLVIEEFENAYKSLEK